ncbi:MAG: DUF126 domain-containing protein [Actinobacteria bacterium]|nr:DUF126 domain-containing protein [Actinomycetota bacterium]
MTVRGRPLLPGAARAEAFVLDEPLSFWGGFESGSGRIVDRRHPQCGEALTGRIVAMPSGRGSSSSSSVLAESVRVGTAPAGVLLREADEIVVLGLLVAQELYGRTVPVVVLDEDAYVSLASGDEVTIAESGEVSVAAR